MFALVSEEKLEALNQLMVKQLKNRYNDPTVNKKFVIGIDRAKMKLYDVENNAQTLNDETAVFGNKSGFKPPFPSNDEKKSKFSGLLV